MLLNININDNALRECTNRNWLPEQVHGTCWFHSAMNAMILSKNIWQLLLIEYQNYNGTILTDDLKKYYINVWNDVSETCIEHTATYPKLMSYVYACVAMIKGDINELVSFTSGARIVNDAIKRFPRKEMMEYNEFNVNKTVQIAQRNDGEGQHGGIAMTVLLKTIFGLDKVQVIKNYDIDKTTIRDTVKIVMCIYGEYGLGEYKKYSPPMKIEKESRNYSLECAGITISIDREQHSICGIFCNRAAYVIDSNGIAVVSNWHLGDIDISYYKHIATETIYKDKEFLFNERFTYCIYIRDDPIVGGSCQPKRNAKDIPKILKQIRHFFNHSKHKARTPARKNLNPSTRKVKTPKKTRT